jgi:prophage regulatory protein
MFITLQDRPRLAIKQDEQMTNKFLSKATVVEMTGLSNVTLWRMEKTGDFPKRRQISPNRIAWLEKSVIEWMETRPESDITPPDRGLAA